jgi:hypothetical protein
MAKSKDQVGKTPPEDQPPKKGGRSGSPLNAIVDESIRQQMDAYIESYNARNVHPASIRSTLEAALKMFLKAEGFWPPPSDQKK